MNKKKCSLFWFCGSTKLIAKLSTQATTVRARMQTFFETTHTDASLKYAVRSARTTGLAASTINQPATLFTNKRRTTTKIGLRQTIPTVRQISGEPKKLSWMWSRRKLVKHLDSCCLSVGSTTWLICTRTHNTDAVLTRAWQEGGAHAKLSTPGSVIVYLVDDSASPGALIFSPFPPPSHSLRLTSAEARQWETSEKPKDYKWHGLTKQVYKARVCSTSKKSRFEVLHELFSTTEMVLSH